MRSIETTVNLAGLPIARLPMAGMGEEMGKEEKKTAQEA